MVKLGVVLIVGIFMLGIVSAADINLAASSKGGVCAESPLLNDGDETTRIGSYCGNTPCSLSYTGTITFANPSHITNFIGVWYIASGWSVKPNPHWKMELYYNGNWNVIGEGGTFGHGESFLGDWQDVTQARITVSNSDTGLPGNQQPPEAVKLHVYLYEIEAWGPEPKTCGDDTCDSEETCGDTDVAPECHSDCGACPTCSDGLQNQDETGVDCGGPCPACPTCFDGEQNQGETEADCGGPCPACPDYYWVDMKGIIINQGMPNIGDTIQAVATKTSSGTFTIEEYTDGNEYIRVDVDGESDGKGNWIYKWKITQDDLTTAGGLGSIEEFVFRVDDGEDSDSIGINGTYDDSLMEVTIVSPACGSNYSKGDSVTIEVTATDEDDFLTGTLSVGGVVNGTFVNGATNFPYTFNVAGNVQIVAEAVNTRGKRARHISNVMILDGDGTYVAACIDKPKDFSDMEESSVYFDASTTRAIVIDNGVFAPYTPEKNPDKFSWYWNFMPENIIRECSGNCGSEYYKFTAEFPIAGDNSAGLRVEFL